MPSRHLIFLDSPKAESGGILIEGEPATPGRRVSLKRRRSPWDPDRDIERIIIGSHPARADVLIQAEGVKPEHVRLYLPLRGEGDNDLKVMVDATVEVNGRQVLHDEWYALKSGDQLGLGKWLFCFEEES